MMNTTNPMMIIVPSPQNVTAPAVNGNNGLAALAQFIAIALMNYADFLSFMEVSLIRILSAIIILAKVYLNHKHFLENPIYLVYFFLLPVGNILYAASAIYTTHQLLSKNLTFSVNSPIVSILSVLGTLVIDTFFGLFPNFIYSLYNTSIAKDIGALSVNYFIANGVANAVFFVVIFIMNIVLSQSNAVEILLIVQLGYVLVVYGLLVMVVWDVPSRVKSVVCWLYVYFLVYAALQVIRCVFAILNNSDENVSNYSVLVLLEKLSSAALFICLCFYVRDLKLREPKGSSSNSDKASI
jgi:hypothetical protein